jgi:aromatic ring-opening dioxygenase catalytic subunit (LigB family)
MSRLPTLFIPHGGGPCFFMDWNPPDTWDRMADYLRSVPDAAGAPPPKALVVISGHWEEPVVTIQNNPAPSLLYDYYGFPPSTYEIKFPALGAPAVSVRVAELLETAGIAWKCDHERGFDHGVFIPLKVAYPEPRIPTVQLSLRAGLDPAEHLAIGRALAPLRDEGVFIVGSGMSYHNMRGFMAPGTREVSARFDEWLATAVAADPAERDAGLAQWSRAPMARQSHPREEHLLPLMVVAGAAGADRGRQVLRDEVMGAVVSAFRFD